MSKHTPGPWTPRRVDNQEWEIDALDGDRTLNHSSWIGLATVYGSDDMPRKGRMVAEANANLIAAAPEMLDMLEECLNVLGKVDAPSGMVTRVWSVIQKANGNDATTE